LASPPVYRIPCDLSSSGARSTWGLGYLNRTTLSVINDNALPVAKISNFCSKEIEARLSHMMAALTPATISNDFTVYLELTGQFCRD
jgi:hypothetical protein